MSKSIFRIYDTQLSLFLIDNPRAAMFIVNDDCWNDVGQGLAALQTAYYDVDVRLQSNGSDVLSG